MSILVAVFLVSQRPLLLCWSVDHLQQWPFMLQFFPLILWHMQVLNYEGGGGPHINAVTTPRRKNVRRLVITTQYLATNPPAHQTTSRTTRCIALLIVHNDDMLSRQKSDHYCIPTSHVTQCPHFLQHSWKENREGDIISCTLTKDNLFVIWAAVCV